MEGTDAAAVELHARRAGNFAGGSVDLRLDDGEVEVLSNTSRFEVIHGPAPRPIPTIPTPAKTPRFLLTSSTCGTRPR